MLEDMEENKDYHNLCPLEAYDSFSLSPEIIGDSYGDYDFTKFINDICTNQDGDDSKYVESQTLYYNGNYITDSCLESTDVLKNSNNCDTYKKKERRKTCKFLNFTSKKYVSPSKLSKSKHSPQSLHKSKYSPIQTEKKLNKSDSLSNQTSPDLCNRSLENIGSSTSISLHPIIDENSSPIIHSPHRDSFNTCSISDRPLNTENNQSIMNLPHQQANLITIPVINGKFTADGGRVFLSSSAVITEPLYSGESEPLIDFEGKSLHHEMQLIENDCNYDIIETSSPLNIDIDLESNNSCSSLLFTDESSKDFEHSSSTSLAFTHPPVKDPDSISKEQLSELQNKLIPDSYEMEISQSSRNQSMQSQTELRSESNIVKVDPIPPGRKRRPRVSYDTLTEEEKIQRIRIMNNDACLRYRKNKKKTIKELEKEIHELETRNEKLKEIHKALKARKEKADQLIADFFPSPSQPKAKGKSAKRKSPKQKTR